MELYAWQNQDGGWVFSVLMGTNRIKSPEEVQANPLDLDGVEGRFLEMATGEFVILYAYGPGVPADLVGKLEGIAARCEVELHVPSYSEERVD